MAEIRPLEIIAQKWGTVTPQRQEQYKQGVMNPRRDWARAAAAADPAYRAGVTAAAGAGRFASGVNRAGTAKWSDRAQRKGPGRFAEGVQIGQSDYQAGFAPYHQVIASVNPPPRQSTGNPANINRVTAFSNALFQRRVGATATR